MEKSTQQFIQYVELDQRIGKVEQEVTHLGQKLNENRQKRLAIEETTAAAVAGLHDATKNLDMSELELKTIGGALSQKRAKLEAANSPKEYTSLEHEIADLEKKQDVLENKGLEALTAFEEAQREADGAKAREPEMLKEIMHEHEDLGKESRHTQALKDALIAERDEAALLVKPDELERYVKMKEKVPNPVVPIIRGSCSGCFYAVNKQNMSEAAAGKLVTCTDCYRLLYDPSAFNNAS